jgi:hypothetical protein
MDQPENSPNKIKDRKFPGKFTKACSQREHFATIPLQEREGEHL